MDRDEVLLWFLGICITMGLISSFMLVMFLTCSLPNYYLFTYLVCIAAMFFMVAWVTKRIFTDFVFAKKVIG